MLLIGAILRGTNCYLEFPLLRASAKTPQFTCQSGTGLDGVCLYRDIAYNSHFKYYEKEDQQLYLGFDLNLHRTWIKATRDCVQVDYVTKAREDCHFLDTAEDKKQKGKKTQAPTHKDLQAISDYGLIIGDFLDQHSLHVSVRNTGLFRSIKKILLIGLFIEDDFTDIQVMKTDILTATELPKHISILTDGRLSMMFGKESFLDEVLYPRNHYGGRIVSIWLDPDGGRGSICMGDLCSKYLQGGYSQLSKYPLEVSNNSMAMKRIDIDLPNQDRTISLATRAIFCLQCSYIGLPPKSIVAFIKAMKADNFNCQIEDDGFMGCESRKGLISSRLDFQIAQGVNKLQIQLGHLISSKEKGYLMLRLRQSNGDFVILGEPLFRQHFVALNYQQKVVMLGQARRTFREALVKTVHLIRLVVCVFACGFAVLFCYAPFRNLFYTTKFYLKMMDMKNSVERMRLRAEPVQELELAQLNQPQEEELAEGKPPASQ